MSSSVYDTKTIIRLYEYRAVVLYDMDTYMGLFRTLRIFSDTRLKIIANNPSVEQRRQNLLKSMSLNWNCGTFDNWRIEMARVLTRRAHYIEYWQVLKFYVANDADALSYSANVIFSDMFYVFVGLATSHNCCSEFLFTHINIVHTYLNALTCYTYCI